MPKGKITIDENICKGCELCVAACPLKILELDAVRLNAKGYHPASVREPDKCSGCACCATMCPDCAIVVEKP